MNYKVDNKGLEVSLGEFALITKDAKLLECFLK